MKEPEIITKLKEKYDELKPTFKILENQDNLTYWIQNLEITLNNKSYSVLVDDEYGDCIEDKPLLLFHLIIQACRVLEENISEDSWIEDHELEINDFTKKIYKEQKKTIIQLRKIIGEIDTIQDYEIEFKRESIEYLREL